jgi:hypothetical protein
VEQEEDRAVGIKGGIEKRQRFEKYDESTGTGTMSRN